MRPSRQHRQQKSTHLMLWWVAFSCKICLAFALTQKLAKLQLDQAKPSPRDIIAESITQHRCASKHGWNKEQHTFLSFTLVRLHRYITQTHLSNISCVCLPELCWHNCQVFWSSDIMKVLNRMKTKPLLNPNFSSTPVTDLDNPLLMLLIINVMFSRQHRCPQKQMWEC